MNVRMCAGVAGAQELTVAVDQTCVISQCTESVPLSQVRTSCPTDTAKTRILNDTFYCQNVFFF